MILPVSRKGHTVPGRNKVDQITSNSLTHCTFTLVTIDFWRENWKEMKLNEPGIRNLEEQNSWQLAKHPGVYSELLRAQKKKFFTALDSQQTGPKFLHARYPTEGPSKVTACRWLGDTRWLHLCEREIHERPQSWPEGRGLQAECHQVPKEILGNWRYKNNN